MATNGVRCSYEEIIDLHTESDRVTAIGIHTPTGDYPYRMFKGFFDMYRKYKYLGCSIKFVPVAKLPADPLQVSYEAGEPTIDPRDLANPIMFHGCHGDDLGTILNKLYGDDNGISDSLVGMEFEAGTTESPLYESLERLYYKALTDRTWKKAGAQRGFQKSGLRPLVYSLATNHQLMPSFGIAGGLPEDGQDFDDFGGSPTSDYTSSVAGQLFNPVRNDLQLFTPRLTGLGWMETRNVLTLDASVSEGDFPEGDTPYENNLRAVTKGFVNQINYAYLPKLFMGVILLAPAYKTEQYYRCIIKHFFAFRQFRGISFRPEVTDVPTYWNKNADLFDGLDEGHFNEIPIESDSSGGGGDDPTITVTDFTLNVFNRSSVDSTPTVYVKYPGTSNFVRWKVINVPAGVTYTYLFVNFPVGSVWTLDPNRTDLFQELMAGESQSTNLIQWTRNADNTWSIGNIPAEESNSASLVKVVLDEL